MKAEVVERIIHLDPKDAAVLFKPVQLRVLEKFLSGENLTENEKRYLRGNLGRKIRVIGEIIKDDIEGNDKDLSNFLKSLQKYYITGYAALKHNGFGWHYEPKYIEVINTKLEGSMRFNGKRVIFKRVRSLGTDNWKVDPDTGLRYATNERILQDAKRAQQTELIRMWASLLERYGKMFVEEPEEYDQFRSNPSR